MAKKYLKNEKGIVRATTTNSLQLEKPLLNEHYDIEVHNRNMDKIDTAIQNMKGKVDGLELKAKNVIIEDKSNSFNASNVEDALLENRNSILSNIKLINALDEEVNGQRVRGINIANALIDKIEG